DRLSEYLDGEISGPERTTLEAHVASCDACRTTLDELRRVVTNARALDDRPPTVDLWPAIATRIGLASRSTVRPLARRFAFTVPQLARGRPREFISEPPPPQRDAAETGAPAPSGDTRRRAELGGG